MSTLQLSTKVLHAGHQIHEEGGARAVPIHQSSSYVFKGASHAANLFNLTEAGFIYTRLNNPTNDILEKRLAEIEGGIGALVTASGAAAIHATLSTILRNGDELVASNSLYGGTYNLLDVSLRRCGIQTSFVDAGNIAAIKAAITPNTKAIFIESIGNPKLDVLDIAAIAEVAKANNIPLIVDNTVATPLLLNPIKYGANIVIHSLTKYINGNGTALGGAIIDGGNFNWNNTNFPEFTNPSPGYHGLNYHETFGAAAFIVKARIETLRDFGAALSPFNAFQIIQGLETLPLRIEKHSKQALALAEWLSQQEEVAWVNYPGLKTSQYYSLVKKYLPNGQSGLLTFGLKGGYEAAKKVVNATRIFSLVANIGDTKSLLIHPASTTHQQLSDADQEKTGVTKDLIRLSVGIESLTDLKEDLKSAFRQLNP